MPFGGMWVQYVTRQQPQAPHSGSHKVSTVATISEFERSEFARLSSHKIKTSNDFERINENGKDNKIFLRQVDPFKTPLGAPKGPCGMSPFCIPACMVPKRPQGETNENNNACHSLSGRLASHSLCQPSSTLLRSRRGHHSARSS